MLPRTATSGLADDVQQIAGLLRLVFTSDTAAEATVVIDPKARSIGITHACCSNSSASAQTTPDGWAGTGARTVTAWSRGNHPAAGRLSDRFLVPRTRRTWKLIRAAAPDEAAMVHRYWSRSTPGRWPKSAGPTARIRGRYGRWRCARPASLVGLASLDLQPVESPEFGRMRDDRVRRLRAARRRGRSPADAGTAWLRPPATPGSTVSRSTSIR